MANDIHTQPPWLVEVAIEPKSKADREVLDITLAKLAAEDPSFRVSTDQESGMTILKGMGELHLDTKLDILRRTYKVEANIGRAAGGVSRAHDSARRSGIHSQEDFRPER